MLGGLAATLVLASLAASLRQGRLVWWPLIPSVALAPIAVTLAFDLAAIEALCDLGYLGPLAVPAVGAHVLYRACSR